MKVLVMSDTHGYLTNAMKAIEKNPDVEMIIHLGDYCRDVADLEQLYPDKKFEYVYGNSDFGVGTVEVEKTLEIEGRRVFFDSWSQIFGKVGSGAYYCQGRVRKCAYCTLWSYTYSVD
ncbi:metallophosphoesterase family protein [Ruminiclostridium josui]|uniref:metallophosphoesterase family protein n=1 Tax=Ruminiclostridium josui TaxID=1499 RepID=UPI000B1341EB|nr:metallophosphoesterase family protein [Ruminiclostridium josui]